MTSFAPPGPAPELTGGCPPPARVAADAGGAWAGRNREYDLVKEFAVAVVVVSLLVAALAAVFSSPDEQPVTLQSWSRATPTDFVVTAASELDGTSGTAAYGAPYNRSRGVEQTLGPLSLQHLAGVTHPVDSARDFVIGPLLGISGDAGLTAALEQYAAASARQRASWAAGYDAALQKSSGTGPATVPAGDYGPVPILLGRLLHLAQAGALEGALLAQGSFYQSDYTRPLLFLADGSFLKSRAAREHLTGTQWGMMNETGSFPGQAWLWLYTLWYQVPPFSTSTNADALVMVLMSLASLALICVPFLPGVRSIPRWIPVHRLIWRSYYRQP